MVFYLVSDQYKDHNSFRKEQLTRYILFQIVSSL